MGEKKKMKFILEIGRKIAPKSKCSYSHCTYAKEKSAAVPAVEEPSASLHIEEKPTTQQSGKSFLAVE